MIFGRPVLPPEVGAFHDAAMRIVRQRVVAERGIGLDRVDHHERRLGELDDRVPLALREPVRDGLRRRAALPRRDRRLVERDPVRQADGDEVVETDARGAQVACESVGAALELGRA